MKLHIQCANKLTLITFQSYKHQVGHDGLVYDKGVTDKFTDNVPRNFNVIDRFPESWTHYDYEKIDIGRQIVKDANEHPQIIWTQDLMLFTSIRVAVHHKAIDAKDVGMNYIHGPLNDIQVTQINIDSNGRFDKQPRGFFDHYCDLLMEIITPYDQS